MSRFAKKSLALLAALVLVIVGAGQLSILSPASAVPPAVAATFVDLGAAETYSVLGGTGVTNTGAGTVLPGDLGLSPTGAIAFGTGTVNGAIHDKDLAAATAQTDRLAAYDDAAAQPGGAAFAGDQAGVTFHPGVHTSAAAYANTGTMTLDADGDSSAVFVFQIGAAFSPAAASSVVLTDGALANNVFWQVNGAVSIGAGATYVGTFLVNGAVTLGDGVALKGRALSSAAVTLTNSVLTEPKDDLTAPIVTVDGGSTRSTNDTTPTISGTTDEPVGRPVTVTVGGQTLTTSVSAGGAWGVSATDLAEGPHNVVASLTDASQNVGTATQILTVDVTAPIVSIDGGATRATNDATPSISGTAGAPASTHVTVTVGGQTLATTIGAGGAWTVTAASLTEAPHSVVASVDDGAQNTGTANQVLTVDATLPVVTIDGGASRSTDDTSPWIFGTTAEQAGTTVHVTVGGQALTAIVATGGMWGVSATTLPKGPHNVVASVTDNAQNTGKANQVLTIVGAGGIPVLYQPDAAIRVLKGSWAGIGIYDGSEQRATKRLRGHVRTARFEVRMTNRGESTDRLQLRGPAKNRKFKVTYMAGGRDVTRAIAEGTFRTSSLRSGESTRLFIKVTRTKAARPGDRRTLEIRTASWHAQTLRDTVVAVVRVTR